MSGPFNRYRRGFSPEMPTANPEQAVGGNLDVFGAMATTERPEIVKEHQQQKVIPIDLPRHLYIPEGAQSLDFRKVMNIIPATVDYELFSFTAPPGAATRFISYGIFNDGDAGANYNFRPLVSGSRVFPYHGDPSDNFRIYLGLGPDLSNSALIPCQLMLQPGQTIRWLVTNTSAVDTSMGVRMVGYLDTTQIRQIGRSG